ncbi:unnamed protein product [Parnassius mnemosyne]|uniref:Tc1-like transposase DDE domain-containing protein n=1 Tax=Parnassius mnemosyne TaxID=213953 RepID=A0AAV1M056_9NEOP
MISKFQEKQREKDCEFNQKRDFLRVVLDFLAPTSQSRKNEIRECLTLNDISFEQYHTKVELVCLVKRNTTEPVYEADELLKQNGHEALRLSPYHCDLNAIDLVWSLAKRKVATKNITLPAEDLEKLIKESFESITPQKWKKMTDHVIRIENKYIE